MKEHEDRDVPSIEKSSVIVDSTVVEETVSGERKVLSERDEGEDVMVDVVGADAVDLDRKADCVRLVEECMQKETESGDVNMDMKEAGEGEGEGEEDVCHDSVGTSVLALEKVEVTVNEEVSKTSVEVRDCEMALEPRGEPQFGGGDVDVEDGEEVAERGSAVEQHVKSVEERMQKETETCDLNMNMEEAAVSGEDVCRDSVGSGVVGFEKVEVTVIEEGLKTSVEVSKDVVQGNVVTACGSLVQDSKESSIGGGEIVAIDNKNLNERGSTKEVVEQHAESVEEVADGDRVTDGKTKKEDEILDSLKIAESLEVDEIVTESFASKDEAEDNVSVDPSLISANNQNSSAELVNAGTDEVAGRSKEESLHPTIEVITDDSQGNASGEPRFVGGENDLINKEEESERGLPKEIMQQPMECDEQVGDGDCMVNEKIGKESAPLDSSKISEPSTTTNPGSEDVDVVVVEEGLARKDEAQDGVSVDPSLACADNRSSSTKVASSATSEGDVIAQAENVDQQAEVIANDAQNLENGTGVGDSKSAVDSSSGEPQFGGETAVIDIEETEKGLTAEDVEIVEQHPESVQEVIRGDVVMDEKTGKEDEVLDSSKIPETLTTVNLCPVEVLTMKIEAQDSDSVGQRLVCPDFSTENSDQQAEVDTMSKDESMHPTTEITTCSEVDEVTTASELQVTDTGGMGSLVESQRLKVNAMLDRSTPDVAACTEPESSIVQMTPATANKVVKIESEDQNCMVDVENQGLKAGAMLDHSTPDVAACTEPESSIDQMTPAIANKVVKTENEDQNCMVDVEDRGLKAGVVLDHSTPDPDVAVCTEPESSIDQITAATANNVVKIESEDQNCMVYVEDQGLKAGAVCAKPSNEVPSTGEMNGFHVSADAFEEVNGVTPCADVAKHCVVHEDSGFSYEDAHMERGEDAGMDIDEVLGWKDEMPGIDVLSGDPEKDQNFKVNADSEGCNIAGNLVSSPGFKKRKALDSISDGSEKRPSLHPEKVPTALISTPKPSFKVGECIQRVASQLSGPPSVLKSNSDPNGQHVDQLVGPENSQRERLIVESNQSSVADMLSQLHLVAQNPMEGYNFLNTILPFFYDHRAVGRPVSVRKRKTSNENEPEEFEFDDVNDSYWTDRIIQNHPEEQVLQENQNGGQEHHVVAYEPDKPAKANRRSNKKRFMFSNHEMGLKEQSELVERRRQNLATEVVLKFPEGIYFPSEIHLNKMFRRFGALMESETEVDRQNGRARVVFKKCCDAEVAHSSAGKFNIFGPINVNYELNYTPLVSYKPLPLLLQQDSMDGS